MGTHVGELREVALIERLAVQAEHPERDSARATGHELLEKVLKAGRGKLALDVDAAISNNRAEVTRALNSVAPSHDRHAHGYSGRHAADELDICGVITTVQCYLHCALHNSKCIGILPGYTCRPCLILQAQQ
jgi:hypothetical protein